MHPVFAAGGELAEFVGTVVDVTERKRAEEDHRAQLWFLESMDVVDRAIQGTSDLEQMMGDVLDVVLATFRCDRAWLVYPCDPAVDSRQVRIERTRPEYVGASGTGVAVPDEPETAEALPTPCWPRAVPCDSIPNQTVRFRHDSRSVSASSP